MGEPCADIVMKWLICGGRDFEDAEYFRAVMELILKHHDITCIVEGGARGADKLASYWAQHKKIDWRQYPALWNDIDVPGAVIRERGDGSKYNVIAGPQRNQRMLDCENPDFVLAFPGGRGTADMIERGSKHPSVKEVIVVYEKDRQYTIDLHKQNTQ